MSRIRSIKPEFWTSEQVVSMSRDARLLFIAMWNFADDFGIIPASAKSLKMKALPGDDITIEQVNGLIREMIDQGLVVAFESEKDGQQYLEVTGWNRHQRVDRPNSKYPKNITQNQNSTSTRRMLDDRSTSSTPRSGVEWSGKEGKGKEGSGCEAHTHTHDDFSNSFSLSPNEPETAPPTPSPQDETQHEYCTRIICEYLRPTDWARLRTICEKADYNPQIYGPARDEIAAFISHYLGSDKCASLLTDPVKFLTNLFPGWLKNAKKFNRPAKSGQNAKQKPPKTWRISHEDARRAAKTLYPDVEPQITANNLQRALKAENEAQFYELLNAAATNARQYTPNLPRTGLVGLGDLTQNSKNRYKDE